MVDNDSNYFPPESKTRFIRSCVSLTSYYSLTFQNNTVFRCCSILVFLLASHWASSVTSPPLGRHALEMAWDRWLRNGWMKYWRPKRKKKKSVLKYQQTCGQGPKSFSLSLFKMMIFRNSLGFSVCFPTWFGLHAQIEQQSNNPPKRKPHPNINYCITDVTVVVLSRSGR